MRPGRVVVLVAVTVVLQVALFPHLRVAGRVPDLGLVVAIAVAFDHGPEAGALVGFLAGFGFDLFLETPLGLSALAYALTAYSVGVLQGGVLRTPRWFTPVIGALGGLTGGMLFVGIGLLAGVDGVHGNHAFASVVVASLYDALLAPFAFIAIGAWLREPRDRIGRRRMLG
jgi:rod shape-determining protein MreD